MSARNHSSLMDIESADVIRLMLQFMREQNLHASMQQLQKETGVTLNTVNNVETFLSDVRQGRWDLVLSQVGTLVLPLDKLTILYEQVVFELLENGERDLARELVRSADPLLVLKASNPERYMRLETLCKRPFNAADVYEMGTSKASRRQDIAVALANEVSSVEPSRLLVLLGQALKYQQAQGMIPQGNNFDLFRNSRKAARREADERIAKVPLPLLTKIQQLPTSAVGFSPDGASLLVGAGPQGLLQLWDSDSAQLRDDLEYQHSQQYLQQGAKVTSVIFSRDGDHVALGDSDGNIKIWKISSGQAMRTFQKVHRGAVLSLCFAKDGTQLLSASFDQSAKIHGLKGGKTLKEFRGHTAFVSSAIYTKDAASNVLTSSADGTVRLWDAKTTECLITTRPGLGSALSAMSETPVLSLTHMPGQSQQVLACLRSSSAYLLDSACQTLQAFSSGKRSGGDFLCATVSSQGKWLYCVGEDNTLYIFDVLTGKLEETVALSTAGEVQQIAHHPLRNMLVIVTSLGDVQLMVAK